MQVHRDYMNKFKQESVKVTDTKYQDYYQLLGLERDASHTEVRSHRMRLNCLFSGIMPSDQTCVSQIGAAVSSRPQ